MSRAQALSAAAPRPGAGPGHQEIASQTALPLHTHDHDEEGLRRQGECLLDDLPLQAGDYPLACSGHRIAAPDTGVVIYAHGGLDLQCVA